MLQEGPCQSCPACLVQGSPGPTSACWAQACKEAAVRAEPPPRVELTTDTLVILDEARTAPLTQSLVIDNVFFIILSNWVGYATIANWNLYIYSPKGRSMAVEEGQS